jgi:hypothetical protein
MRNETGQPFHLVSVHSFLLHAKTYLAAQVSDSTVEQAEQVQISERTASARPRPLRGLHGLRGLSGLFQDPPSASTRTALQAAQQAASGLTGQNIRQMTELAHAVEGLQKGVLTDYIANLDLQGRSLAIFDVDPDEEHERPEDEDLDR